MFNKAVLWDLSYGVYVISSMDKKRPTGCIANCAVQLTHDTIALSLNHSNYTNSVIKENKEIAISILSQKTDANLISVFGFTSGRDTNKFEKVKYKLINNLPIVQDSRGYLTLKCFQQVELETHTLFIAKITDGDIFNNEIPMTYKFYHDVIKGRAPKAAPTYIAPDAISVDANNQPNRFKCKMCGYIYEGDITKENDNFTCPVCKQKKNSFEAI